MSYDSSGRRTVVILFAHPQEPHSGGTAGRLNWLRAAVLGANDGIVSVAVKRKIGIPVSNRPVAKCRHRPTAVTNAAG